MVATMERNETALAEQRDVAIRIGAGGLHPEDTYPVPSEGAFEIPDPNRGADDEPAYEDYLVASDIERLAAALIARHPEDFKHLKGGRIVYAWKREGKSANGKLRFGSCARLNAKERWGLKADFLIALSADHCRGHWYTARQIEALTYHELLHIGLSDGDEPRLVLVPHEFEGFYAEIRVYGAWHHDLRAAERAFTQPRLDGV